MEHELLDKKQTQISFPTLKSLYKIEEPVTNAEITSTLTETTMEPAQQPEKPEKSKPSNLFDAKEPYLVFKKQWSKLANEKKLTSTMMLFYNLARGKDYFNGFTAITNAVKLANGQKKDKALNGALSAL